MSSRKAETRNAANWLDALDLPADRPMTRTYPAPRTRAKPAADVEIAVSDLCPPADGRNAAEVWGASMPSLSEMRIHEERIRRSMRATSKAMHAPGPGEPQLVLAAQYQLDRALIDDAIVAADRRSLLVSVAFVVVLVVSALHFSGLAL